MVDNARLKADLARLNTERDHDIAATGKALQQVKYSLCAIVDPDEKMGQQVLSTMDKCISDNASSRAGNKQDTLTAIAKMKANDTWLRAKAADWAAKEVWVNRWTTDFKEERDNAQAECDKFARVSYELGRYPAYYTRHDQSRGKDSISAYELHNDEQVITGEVTAQHPCSVTVRDTLTGNIASLSYTDIAGVNRCNAASVNGVCEHLTHLAQFEWRGCLPIGELLAYLQTQRSATDTRRIAVYAHQAVEYDENEDRHLSDYPLITPYWKCRYGCNYGWMGHPAYLPGFGKKSQHWGIGCSGLPRGKDQMVKPQTKQ